MRKSDRWLFTIALNLCFVPIIALGILFQVLPSVMSAPLPIGQEQSSKTVYLMTCLFMLIPLLIIIFAAFLQYKKVVGRNYRLIAIASMLLSVAFTGVTVYCIAIDTDPENFVRTVDFNTIACCVLCVVLSFAGTMLYGLKKNDFIGFNNRYTKSDERVWAGAHNVLSYVANALFAVLAAVISFFRGWYVVVITIAVVLIAVLGVSHLVSYLQYLRVKKSDLAAQEIKETEKES